MNRPQKIKEVYIPISGAQIRNPRTTLDERPLDEVFADGGWKILSLEASALEPNRSYMTADWI